MIARIKNQLLLQKISKQMSEQNLQLQQEIEERKQAEKNIQSALRAKEVLLAEIHCGVKNNLHMIFEVERGDSTVFKIQFKLLGI